MTSDERAFSGGERLVRATAAIAALGAVVLVIGGVQSPRDFFLAYLTAYNFVVSTALGALVLLMICHAMDATWPVLVRRLMEAITATLPLLALLFVPLLFGLSYLYPWVRPAVLDEHARTLLTLKAGYLNVPFFVVRAAVYLLAWSTIAVLLNRWSANHKPGSEHRMYAFSAILLPVVALTLSFASFDWQMSLTPLWFSTMYPIYYFAGGFVSAIAGVTLLAWAARRTGWIEGLNDSHFHALGRLLLAFVIFWAYAGFFQFLLIWIANLPDEVTFYLTRANRAWRVVTVVLVVTHFVLPFLVLLNQDLKRRPGPLAAVAAWIIAAHYIDVHWLVMPAARPTGPAYRVIDFAALLAIAGLTVAFATLRLRGRPMVPLHDPRLGPARNYESA